MWEAVSARHGQTAFWGFLEALNEDGTAAPWHSQEVNQASLHTHSWSKAVPESLGVGFRIYSQSQQGCVVPVLNSVTFWVVMLQQCHRVRHSKMRLKKRLAGLRDSFGENDVERIFLEMSKEGSEPF